MLTVTHERIDMGQMSWTKASNYNVMYANLGGVNTEYNAYCEIYLYSGTVTSAGGAYNKGNNTLSILTNDSRYLIYHYLVYELATPVTYQLTPQEVNSLLATNNFFHDANGDTQVQYRSTSAVVDSKTITANGTYNASADNLDGYSSVSVNVAPNVGTKNITQNGTYTASSESLDGYSEVTVNVSGGEIFSNKYTFTNTPATINKCIIDYAHNSDSLWAHSGSSYAICADSNGNIYYDTTLNAIVRTGSGYYAEITSLGIVASQFRTQDTASMSWTSETWTNSTSSVNVADLSKYIIANTFDILDENGNVVLPANCSLSDLGLA